MKKPLIFILSGPGGAGKTTVAEHLFRKKATASALLKVVTVTTRQKRPQEKEGTDYFFVTKEEFSYLKKKKFFIESEKVLEDFYGTPKFYLKIAKVKNKSLILCIDVKGAMNLKKKYKGKTIVTIFITVAKKSQLYERMKKRDEDQKVIKERIELAKKELQFAKKYDYLIQNKNINVTTKKVEDIILKHHKAIR